MTPIQRRLYARLHGYAAVVVLLLLLPLLPLAAKPVDPGFFRYIKYAHTSAPASAKIGIISFDREMYSNMSCLYSELLITDTERRPLRFIVQKQTQLKLVSYHEECPSKVVSAGESGGERHELVIKNSSGTLVSRIVLNSTGGDYERSVIVQRSEDGENWRTCVDSATIFSFRNRFGLAQDYVDIPTDSSSYFRIIILPLRHGFSLAARLTSAAAAPVPDNPAVRFTGASLLRAFTLTRKNEYHVTSVMLDAVHRQIEDTQCETIVDSYRKPLTGIELEFSRPICLLRVDVCGSRDRLEWRRLTSGNYVNIDFDDIVFRRNTFRFPESRFRYYRIMVSSPVSLCSPGDMIVKGLSPTYRIVIPDSPPNRLLVYYGGVAKQENIRVLPSRESDEPRPQPEKEYRLSPHGNNPDFGVMAQSWSCCRILLFVAAVAGAVALVMYIVVRRRKLREKETALRVGR